jgi:hypothetical protein
VARVVVAAALVLDVVLRHGVVTVDDPIGTKAHRGLLSWDSAWYLDLARHGYHALPDEAVRFFPVLPLVVRGLGAVLGSDAVALLLLANVCALGYLYLLERFLVDDLGSASLAARATWLAALAPVGFVLAMGYTEALAAMAVVGAFWAARRRSWGIAALCALAAGALRPSGLLLGAPLAVEAALAWRSSGGVDRLRSVLATVAPALGALPYLLWVRATYGDALLPFRVQMVDGLRGDTVDPFRATWHAFAGLDGSDIAGGLRGVWVLVFVALLVAGARRLPVSYTVFGAVTLLVAASTEHIGSFERYATAAFPLVVSAALLLPRRRLGAALVVAASAAVMGTYAVLAFLDIYVP